MIASLRSRRPGSFSLMKICLILEINCTIFVSITPDWFDCAELEWSFGIQMFLCPFYLRNAESYVEKFFSNAEVCYKIRGRVRLPCFLISYNDNYPMVFRSTHNRFINFQYPV